MFENLKQLFTTTEESDYAIVLDVGTEFVKSLIFKVIEENGTKKGIVVGVGKQRQRVSDMYGGAVSNISGVIENCRAALARALEMADVHADQVIIGIAGELVKGMTSVFSYTRTNSKNPINHRELSHIIEQAQKTVFEQTKKTISAETGHDELAIRLVNAVVIKIEIDGYIVTNPIGFTGRNLIIHLYNSFAPSVHLRSLETIASELNLELLTLTAEPYAVAKAVGEDESNEFSAVIIDIGGGTTDIAVVIDGGLLGTKMFSFGGRAFTKHLAAAQGISFLKAEDLKIAYAKNNLPKKQHHLVSDTLYRDTLVWKSGVELLLSDFEGIEKFPQRILLCGGGSLLPEIFKALNEIEIISSPTVSYMYPKDVKNIIDETGLLDDPSDVTPLSLAHVGLDYAGQESVVSDMLKKVTNIIRS